MKGGDTNIKRVKVSKGSSTNIFIALRNLRGELTHKTVKDEKRRNTSVILLFQAVDGYIPQPSDNIFMTSKGFPSLKKFTALELTNNKEYWESMGLKRGMLPNYTFFDPAANREVGVPMTINGIEIDTTDPGVIRKYQLLSSYPPSLMHESLDMIETIFNKYFDDSDRPRRNPNILEILHRIQRVMIALQNLLFEEKQRIQENIKSLTSKICTNRREMLTTKEGLILNIAMLELADSQLSFSFDRDTVLSLIDSYHGQIGDAVFSNPCEKIRMAELLQNTRSDRDRGNSIDLEYVLDEMVNVFKQEVEQEELSLQSALLASGPSRNFQSHQDAPVRSTTGGDFGTGKRRAETTTTQPTEEESKILNIILKAINDLKSEMGSIKKLIQPRDSSKPGVPQHPQKPGWRNIEQDGKAEKRTRFAGVASEAVKSQRVVKTTSGPTPLLTTVSHIDSSSDSSDLEANFAGQIDEYKPIHHFNPRILTAHHNVNELGYKCLDPPRSLLHARQGIEHEISQLTFFRLADNFQQLERMHESMITNPLPCSWAQGSSEETMASIGGQQEVITVPDVIQRAKTPVEEVCYSKQIYHPTVTPIRSLEELTEMRRAYYGKSSPPPRATAFGAQPSFCTFSPSAPQVVNYVHGTIPPAGRNIQVEDPVDAKIAAACDQIQNLFAHASASKNFLVIPESRELSDSEEDEILKAKTHSKRSRFPKTSTARKIIIATPQGHGDPRTTLEQVDPRLARRQARDAKLQSSNIESSTSSASMSPSTMTAARSTSTSGLPAGGTAVDEDSDTMPDLMPSSDDEDPSTD